MHASVCTSKSRSMAAHHLLVLVAVVLGLGLAFCGTASAQTGFQATVTAKNPKPKPCPNNLFACGTASTNYGPATWTFDLTSFTLGGTCDPYTATVTFVLADDSTLVLDETGITCGPGNSALSNASANSFGHPNSPNGTWSVVTTNGQFDGLTGTTGTDALDIAGAQTSGTYTATP